MFRNISNLKALKFSFLSGDRNKIHLNKSFTKNYFFKKPVVHGIHLVLIGITKYLNKNKNYLITNINLNFLNFCLVNERFRIDHEKDKIIISGTFDKKVLIEISKQENSFKGNVIEKNYKNFFNLKNNKNNNLYKHLLYVSYFIGSVKPGNGALIHSIKSKRDNKNRKNKIFFVKKVLKNVFLISIFYEGFVSEVSCSKSQPLLDYGKKLKLSKNTLRKIQGKKMFIIGSKADVGVYLSTFFLKNNIRTFKYDFKITNKRYLKKEIREIKKEIIKIKPDYIFYLSSPKIIHDHIYSKKLFYLFDLVYCVFFKSILDILKKSNLRSKVFFPSSLFVKKSEDKNYLKSYVKAKKKAEMICKKHPYKKLVSVYRLPQFKTKSNYNILGYYEGTELNRISKYLSKFFS